MTPSARFRHASSLRGLNVEENRGFGDQLGNVSEFFGGVRDAVMHTVVPDDSRLVQSRDDVGRQAFGRELLDLSVQGVMCGALVLAQLFHRRPVPDAGEPGRVGVLCP